MKKKYFGAGDVFTFPICGNKYAIGIIARIDIDIALSYFFNYVFDNIPNEQLLEGFIKRDNVILVRMISTLGLRKNTWKIIGKFSKWQKDEWEVPNFRRIISPPSINFKISYDDNLKEIHQERVTEEEALLLYPDGLLGYMGVEKVISKILGCDGSFAG